MAKEINHWCVVCGNGYNACDNCDKFNHWKAFADTVNHYKIFFILQDYNNKKITKAEAKETLSNMDISGWESWKDSSKNLMNEIMSTENAETVSDDDSIEKKRKKSTKVKRLEVVDDENKEE